MADTKTVVGVVQNISVFSIDSSTFSIRTSDGKYYAVGKIMMLNKGMKVKLTGKIDEGLSGKYIYFDEYEIQTAQTPKDVELFLTNIPGVGTKTAHKIVSYYGDDACDQLFVKQNVDDAPITDKLKDNISIFMADFVSQLSIYTRLRLTTLSLRKAYSIYKYLQKHTELDLEHPFEVAKLPFVDLNDIKQIHAVAEDKTFLEEAVALCAVRAKATNPHNEYVEANAAIRSVRYHLSREKIATGSMSTQVASEALEALVDDGILNTIEINGVKYYTLKEIEDAKDVIYEFMNQTGSRIINDVDETAKDIFKGMAIVPSDKQLEAMHAINDKFAVITGSAGTGKSLVISALYTMYKEKGFKCSVLAPTGKAADRLTDFGISAMTIHRKVEYNGAEAARNEYNPLDVDAVIVDESSMVDYATLAMLIKALPEFASLILVGDSNQLPPVGIGKPFVQAVNMAKKIYKLDRIYRQEGRNGILSAASNILAGRLPRRKPGEVIFYKAENKEEAIKVAETVYKRFVQKAGEERVKHNVMIVTATRDMADSLNHMIRSNIFNINPQIPFAVGDKVMQTVNNYDKEVFNGEIGFVREADGDIEVEFGSKLVQYTPIEFAELDYAYATTVHKAQGSEASVVIFLLVQSIISNTSKELVYTAVTRAKRMLVLITNTKDFYTAVSKSIKNSIKEGVESGNVKTAG